MTRSHKMEEYLEAIYVLDSEGETVLPSRLADYLSVSRPTVTQTVQRMNAAGFVRSNSSKEIMLTDEGLTQAESMVRRHRVLERWLNDELGLDWADAHVEAARLEGSVSPLVLEQLYERLGQPKTCPHGNIIPGSGYKHPHSIALSDAPRGKTVEIIRIVEIAEEDLELLRFFHRSGLVPGGIVTPLAAQNPYETDIPVLVDGKTISLNQAVAARVLITDILPEA
jgi:DtxR family transcriptional regulator, Mn-dependent transcriptional regulator